MLIQNLGSLGKQIYGVTLEMQIELELESGVIVDINTYEWVQQNYSDFSRLSWNLQDQSDQGTLDGLLKRNLEGQPTFPRSHSILRLFY